MNLGHRASCVVQPDGYFRMTTQIAAFTVCTLQFNLDIPGLDICDLNSQYCIFKIDVLHQRIINYLILDQLT